MKQLLDLDTFAKTLTDKGYRGYFHTQGAYPDKLKESIAEYLENCRNGKDDLPRNEMLLETYLQWNGGDKPYVKCYLWAKFENDMLDVRRMEVERKDRYGQLLQKAELTNLTTSIVPKAEVVRALVSEAPKQKTVQNPKRFKL